MIDANLTSMNTIESGNILNIYSIVVAIISAITIFYLQNRIDKMSTDREKKNKRNRWMRFLSKYNKNIRDSILEFEDIKTPPTVYTHFMPLIGLISGFFGSLFVLYAIVISKEIDAKYFILTSISSFLFIMVVLCAIVDYCINQIEKSGKFLEGSKPIINLITFIKFCTLGSIIESAPFIYITYLMLNSKILSDIESRNISFLILFSSVFLAIIIISTYSYRKNILDHSKYLLNTNFERFPDIQVKTTSVDFQGKICDVFDDNLIILDDAGVKKSAEWDSINYLELYTAI